MTRAVVLSTWGSPISSLYLNELSKVPSLEIVIIYEKNEKLAREIERIYAERFGDAAPKFEPAGPGIQAHTLDRFQSEDGLKFLAGLNPDFFVLAGTGIIKAPLLALPKTVTLNCHPGILPRYRGCTCVEWALSEDEPVGATCHIVTEEIDAGDMLRKEIMPVYQGDSYRDVRLRMLGFQAAVMGRAVAELSRFPEKTLAGVEKFDWNQARYYKPIPGDLLEAVKEKLLRGTYRHAVPIHEKNTLPR